jgi:adenylate cyclase class 2
MASKQEVEIKFRVANLSSLTKQLRTAGFRSVTPSTYEMNTLYDLPGQKLRKNGELLRLRKYGNKWVLTHKGKGKTGRHKTRVETETGVTDGKKMDSILHALGFRPGFRYEKYRAEWSDGKGHVVIDETPVGNFGEIEGPPRWIDRTARLLEISPTDYITLSYVELFFAWKRQTKSSVNEMTFTAVRQQRNHSPLQALQRVKLSSLVSV